MCPKISKIISHPPNSFTPQMASFPRLVAIFYAIFDPDKGAEIQVQSPDEAFNPLSPLFDFSSVSEFIIPKKEMCNQILSFITPSGYRIVGHPVHIPGSKYKRNFFIYNLAFVFDENAEIGSYNPVVRRLAMTFKQLEVRQLIMRTYCRNNRIFFRRRRLDRCFIMLSNISSRILIVIVSACVQLVRLAFEKANLKTRQIR